MISQPFDIELVTACLQAHAIPERSRLFALTPVESPPEQRESLISLLIRTSRAHSVNPRRLIAGVLAQVAPEIEPLVYPGFFKRLAGTINGQGKYASLFVRVLEELTGQRGLSRLTLLPWKDLFPHNGQGMLARHPRWCSACLLEQRRSKEDIYFPLLWSLEPYQHCTIHSHPLDDCCPHCGKRQPFLPRYPDQAICQNCLRSLITIPAPAAGDEELAVAPFDVWVAKVLGDMVARHDDPGFAPSVGQFHTTVKSVVEATTGGNRAAFCRAIGFKHFALKNWMSKGERPSVTQFLALSYAVQVSPLDLVSGSPSLCPIPYSELLLPGKLKTRKRRQRIDSSRRSSIEKWLDEELGSEEALPVSSIAKRWGLTTRYLRYWFPDLCAQITAHYKESLRQSSASRLAAQIQRVREVVRELRDGNRYPSRRMVNAMLRKDRASLVRRSLHEAYLAALTV